KGPLYPFHYPYYDVNENFPPTELFGKYFTEPCTRADPAKPNLLGRGSSIRHLSPYIGSEVKGVQLSQLSKEGLDELALLPAERKVLLFRDQDFKDLGPDRQIEIARHDRINQTSWHSDVSCEKQPPGTTFFILEQVTPIGGDTLFLSQVEAYSRLSPLRAVHSAVAQAELSKQFGYPVRREPVETKHPLVRVHPATGEKDNRVTAHSATRDFESSERRHAVRLTPQAEVPIPATESD
ncbi:Alpha-ketoglutarate-dependent sulfonate dioxygenase, partial [Leucoagaricus sp. SymC.cos]